MSSESQSWTTTNETSISDCRYKPGDQVTCGLKARTQIGYGPVGIVLVNVTCESKCVDFLQSYTSMVTKKFILLC